MINNTDENNKQNIIKRNMKLEIRNKQIVPCTFVPSSTVSNAETQIRDENTVGGLKRQRKRKLFKQQNEYGGIIRDEIKQESVQKKCSMNLLKRPKIIKNRNEKFQISNFIKEDSNNENSLLSATKIWECCQISPIALEKDIKFLKIPTREKCKKIDFSPNNFIESGTFYGSSRNKILTSTPIKKGKKSRLQKEKQNSKLVSKNLSEEVILRDIKQQVSQTSNNLFMSNNSYLCYENFSKGKNFHNNIEKFNDSERIVNINCTPFNKFKDVQKLNENCFPEDTDNPKMKKIVLKKYKDFENREHVESKFTVGGLNQDMRQGEIQNFQNQQNFLDENTQNETISSETNNSLHYKTNNTCNTKQSNFSSDISQSNNSLSTTLFNYILGQNKNGTEYSPMSQSEKSLSTTLFNYILNQSNLSQENSQMEPENEEVFPIQHPILGKQQELYQSILVPQEEIHESRKRGVACSKRDKNYESDQKIHEDVIFVRKSCVNAGKTRRAIVGKKKVYCNCTVPQFDKNIVSREINVADKEVPEQEMAKYIIVSEKVAERSFQSNIHKTLDSNEETRQIMIPENAQKKIPINGRNTNKNGNTVQEKTFFSNLMVPDHVTDKNVFIINDINIQVNNVGVENIEENINACSVVAEESIEIIDDAPQNLENRQIKENPKKRKKRKKGKKNLEYKVSQVIEILDVCEPITPDDTWIIIDDDDDISAVENDGNNKLDVDNNESNKYDSTIVQQKSNKEINKKIVEKVIEVIDLTVQEDQQVYSKDIAHIEKNAQKGTVTTKEVNVVNNDKSKKVIDKDIVHAEENLPKEIVTTNEVNVEEGNDVNKDNSKEIIKSANSEDIVHTEGNLQKEIASTNEVNVEKGNDVNKDKGKELLKNDIKYPKACVKNTVIFEPIHQHSDFLHILYQRRHTIPELMYWQTMQANMIYEMFDVHPLSSEARYIIDLFQQTSPYYQIYNLERIQNPYVMTSFLLNKERAIKIYGKNVDCQFLYHGTTYENCYSIALNNFNWRLYGHSRGHKYGKGVNFTPNANFAINFCDKREEIKLLILAKVLIIKSSTGDNNSFIPPDDCDSTKREDGQVIVKYNDDTFYPAYKILVRPIYRY